MLLRSTFRHRQILALVFLLLATPGSARVLLRWTQPSIPPAANMGIGDLLVSYDAETMIVTARSQGYRVYAEVPITKASTSAAIVSKNDLAGIVLNPDDAQPSQIDDALATLRSAYPEIPVLVLDTRAKQPQMKGQLVIKRDGILQVTSPTAQPWIDTNLALVKLDRAFRPAQTPLYEFRWELSDPLQQEQGPDTADYLLAVAEAAAFHADLVLDLHPKLQTDLLRKDPAAWAVLNEIKRYMTFSSEAGKDAREPEANVGVIADTHLNSYEPINLLARHNIPFQVLTTSGFKPHSLDAFDLLVIFAALDAPNATAVADFAARGGIAVLVGARGPYPWQSAPPVPAGEHAASYALGKGRIIELSDPITDPETFAQDIRRLLDRDKSRDDRDKVLISLWNALTTVAVPYRSPGSSEEVVELVNYAQEPLRVQVRIRGSFSSILYVTPERGCCESLTPVQRVGFTEFVVPSLHIAGRVRLAQGTSPHQMEGK